jgi:hypothetical protein
MKSQQCYRSNHRYRRSVPQWLHTSVLIDNSIPPSKLIRYRASLSGVNAIMTLMNILMTCKSYLYQVYIQDRLRLAIKSIRVGSKFILKNDILILHKRRHPFLVKVCVICVFLECYNLYIRITLYV